MSSSPKRLNKDATPFVPNKEEDATKSKDGSPKSAAAADAVAIKNPSFEGVILLYCSFCDQNGHTRQNCTEFKQRKAATTTLPYMCKLLRLRKEEMDGFSAAGLLLWHKSENANEISYLMIKETRQNMAKWNLIGGKREHFTETPSLTATREFVEESAPLYSEEWLKLVKELNFGSALKHCIWFPQGKYVLYLYQVAQKLLVPKHCGDFRWINNNNLLLNNSWPVHEFAGQMLQLISGFEIFPVF